MEERTQEQIDQMMLQQSVGDMDSICLSYKNKGQRLSDLSMTKYKYLIQKGVSLIHPPVIMSEPKSQFLSQTELRAYDKSLLSKLELPVRERLFKNQSQHSHRDDRSISSFNTYGPKEEIAFQLGHNKQQLERLILSEKQPIKVKESSLKRLPKIKSYPSKIQEGAPVATQKKQTRVLVPQELGIPTHHIEWIDKFQGKWRPPMREGAGFVQVQNRLFLYGGISSAPFNEWHSWCADDWNTIDVIGGERPSFGRTYHAMAVYRRYIFVFGGEKPYDNQQKLRECLNDFRIFNTENGEFKMVRTFGDGVEARRGCASSVVGKHMLVFGGLSSRGKYLNDIFHLDMVQFKIGTGAVENCTYFDKGIAFHGLVSAYSSNRQVQLYKQTEQDSKLEGVYCFGGEDRDGNLYGQLYMLTTYVRPLSWTKVETKGTAPQPRYKHSMNFVERFSIIVIYGGIAHDSTFLGDCHVFKVEAQTWCQVVFSQREGRAGHSAVVDDHRVIIFGGYNVNGFCTSDLQFLETDPLLSLKLHRLNNPHDPFETYRQQDTSHPITQRIEEVKTRRIRQQIESLQFKNMKSFLPMPVMKSPSFSSMKPSKKEQLIIKDLNEQQQHFTVHSPQHQSEHTPVKLRAKTLKNIHASAS